MLIPSPICSTPGPTAHMATRSHLAWGLASSGPWGGCQVPGGATAGAQRPNKSPDEAGRGQGFAWGCDSCSDA